MVKSEAHVSTDAPARYGKQLAGHFGRRIEATWDGAEGRLPFDFGTCTLTAGDGVLVLRAEAPTRDELNRVQEVAGGQLGRFGQRDELTVIWEQSGG